MRVLKWIIDRAVGAIEGQETALGRVPEAGQIDTSGLDLSEEAMRELTAIDTAAWKAEFELQDELFQKLAETMPDALKEQRQRFLSEL